MTEPRADALPVLDEAVVGSLRAVDPALVAQVAGLYQQDAPARVAALRAARAERDAAAAASAAHALKGGSAAVGARRVQALAEQVEAAAHSGALPDDAQLAALEAFIQEAAAALVA